MGWYRLRLGPQEVRLRADASPHVGFRLLRLRLRNLECGSHTGVPCSLGRLSWLLREFTERWIVRIHRILRSDGFEYISSELSFSREKFGYLFRFLANRFRLEHRRPTLARTLECIVDDYCAVVLKNSLSIEAPDDRHVLAAGVHADTHLITTYNRKDYSTNVLSRYGIESLHPDKFCHRYLRRATGPVCSVLKRQRESSRRPTFTEIELLATFENHGLIQCVHGLKAFLDLL